MNTGSVNFSNDDRLNKSSCDRSNNGTGQMCILNGELLDLAPYLRWLVPAMAIAGIVGNVFILIIFNTKGMRTKTNFILSAMAAADLAHAIIAMVTNLYLYEKLIDSDTFSRFYHHRMKPHLMTLINWLAMTSTWLAVAVTIERFIAIRYPLKAHLIMRKRPIVFVTFAIAVISLIVCSYYAFWLRRVAAVSCEDRGRMVYRLTPDPKLFVYGHAARQIHSVLCTVIPIALLFYFNCSLVYYLRRKKNDPTSQKVNESRACIRRMQRMLSHEQKRTTCVLTNDAREHKVAIIVLAISFTTASLLSPSAVMVLYDAARLAASVIGGRSIRTPWWYLPANDVSNTLVFLQKVLDFYLYCFTSRSFRRRLMTVLFLRSNRKPSALSQHRRRSSSFLRPCRSPVQQLVGEASEWQTKVQYQRVISEEGTPPNRNDPPAGKRCEIRLSGTSSESGFAEKQRDEEEMAVETKLEKEVRQD